MWNAGDFVFLVGASGSGKTTLLSLLLREEEATDGEIRVAGNDLRRLTNRQVPQYRRSIGFVFQDYKLLNNKTVWQKRGLRVGGDRHQPLHDPRLGAEGAGDGRSDRQGAQLPATSCPAASSSAWPSPAPT